MNIGSDPRIRLTIFGGYLNRWCGILSTWIYPKSSAPYYNLGARFNLALVAISMVLIVVQVLLLRMLNRRKETHRARILEGMEDLSYEEQLERFGDRHPSYRYTY